MKLRKHMHVILTVAFCVFFIGSFIFLLAKPDQSYSENENRSLAQKPKLSLSSMISGDFMENFEDYIGDQFYARSFLVSMKAETEKLSGKTENNGVFFGKDDYLIGKLTDDTTVSEANLLAIKTFAASLGQDYHIEFFLCPTAANVLKDKLPRFGYDDCQNQLFEEATKQLKNSTVQFIDPREEYKKAQKTNRQLYYRTDHHYTSFGAYIGYTAYCRANDIRPLSESDFRITQVTDSFYGSQWTKASLFGAKPDTIECYDRDGLTCHVKIVDGENVIQNDSLYFEKYLSVKDKYSYFVDGVHPLYEIHTNVKNGKSVLILKDSYAHSALPFLANHYENIYMIDLRYYNGNVANYLKEKNIHTLLFYYNANTFATDDSLQKLAVMGS